MNKTGEGVGEYPAVLSRVYTHAARLYSPRDEGLSSTVMSGSRPVSAVCKTWSRGASPQSWAMRLRHACHAAEGNVSRALFGGGAVRFLQSVLDSAMTSAARTHHPFFSGIEPLEARIAPATFTLPTGSGPYTLEVDPADAHLHIVDGAATEIFDQGLAPWDTLTLDGSQPTDVFRIVASAAGTVSFSGDFNVGIGANVEVLGPLSVFGTGAIQSGGTVNIQAPISFFSTGFTVSALGPEAGLTVGAALFAQSDGNLLLSANGDVHFTANGGVDSPNGLLGITLQADADNSHSGNIRFDTGSHLTSGGPCGFGLSERGLRLFGIPHIRPQDVEQLIPRLPPTVETTGLEPSKVLKLSINEPGRTRDEDADDPTAFKYSVLVPQEFNPHHTYPLIVAMHEGGLSPERALKWWGGDDGSPLQSQRHGYIVIAPEYLPAKFGDPLPAPTETIVWECLRDARRRFSIDSDRIYLSGHGRGAEAAFDVALAHPDLFAGVLPISGGLEHDSKWLQANARDQSWYVVMGEFDFGLYNRNAKPLESLMNKGGDLVIAQYKSRGHESFYSEIHRLFDWMELHRRPAEPKEFELKSIRTRDVRLHWVRWSDAAPTGSRVSKPKTGSSALPKSPNSISLKAKILAGESGNKKTIRVDGRGPITLWLNPTLVDFDKRLVIERDSKQKFNDFLKPEIEAVVEDYRQRGDRQRLHSVRMQID